MLKRDADQHRRRLLDAAEGVFLERGYVASTMGDLAEAMGVSRPALYLVYPSREAIFSAVAARSRSRQDPEAVDLAAWVELVLGFWLGADFGAARARDISDRKSPAGALKQQALLCAVLKEGLVQRFAAEVSEDLQDAVVQLIALCVRGMLDARIEGGEGRALLNIQVNALTTIAGAGRRGEWRGTPPAADRLGRAKFS